MTEDTSKDDHDQLVGPVTTSLQNYQVSIDAQVLKLLTDQLLPSYGGDANAADEHMTRILASLKLPPTPSLCRINWIQASSREALMESIRSNLNENWELSDNVNLTVEPHDRFSDVVEIHASSSALPDEVSQPSFFNSAIPDGGSDESILFSSWPRRQQLGWPMTHRVVICDRFCSEAVLRGSHIFVKGILSADNSIEEGECVAVYGYMGRDKHKPTKGSNLMDVINNTNATNRGPYLFLGLGKAHCPRIEFFSNESGIGVSMTLRRAGPILPPLNSIGKSDCMMQNLPSIVVGHALDPQPGDTILDMCCAPGGKTTHLASLVGGEATIVACDKSRSKMLTVRDLVRGTGAEDCITPLALDATKCVISDDLEQRTIQEVSSPVMKFCVMACLFSILCLAHRRLSFCNSFLQVLSAKRMACWNWQASRQDPLIESSSILHALRWVFVQS